jgi:chromosome segregation ATPase
MREGLENRIVMLAGEIERLNAKNRKKNEENEDLHEQIKRLEQAVADLQPLEGDNRRLDEQLVTKNDEVELWKRRFEEQEDEANKAKSAREGLENRLALLSSEIERMNIKVRNYQKTIEDQTLRIQELEQENNELRKLESTIHELESKLDTTYQELDHLTADLNTKVENINNQNQR